MVQWLALRGLYRQVHSGQTQKGTSLPVFQSLEVFETFTSAKFV